MGEMIREGEHDERKYLPIRHTRRICPSVSGVSVAVYLLSIYLVCMCAYLSVGVIPGLPLWVTFADAVIISLLLHKPASQLNDKLQSLQSTLIITFINHESLS